MARRRRLGSAASTPTWDQGSPLVPARLADHPGRGRSSRRRAGGGSGRGRAGHRRRDDPGAAGSCRSCAAPGGGGRRRSGPLVGAPAHGDPAADVHRRAGRGTGRRGSPRSPWTVGSRSASRSSEPLAPITASCAGPSTPSTRSAAEHRRHHRCGGPPPASVRSRSSDDREWAAWAGRTVVRGAWGDRGRGTRRHAADRHGDVPADRRRGLDPAVGGGAGRDGGGDRRGTTSCSTRRSRPRRGAAGRAGRGRQRRRRVQPGVRRRRGGARRAAGAVRPSRGPAGAELRVRMAVHTGEAQLRDEGNYFGQTIIRCARLRASATAARCWCRRRPLASWPTGSRTGSTLLDLGVHRLET